MGNQIILTTPTLTGLTKCWYEIARQEGNSDEDAAMIALNNLSARMLKMSE
jgi:hypothetical protein